MDKLRNRAAAWRGSGKLTKKSIESRKWNILIFRDPNACSSFRTKKSNRLVRETSVPELSVFSFAEFVKVNIFVIGLFSMSFIKFKELQTVILQSMIALAVLIK